MNKIQKFLSIVFFIAIFIVLIYFIQNYGIEPLRNKVESMGIWAPFGIFILRGVSIILPALPSSAYSLLAGSLLGFQKGYITIIFSDIIISTVCFLVPKISSTLAPIKLRFVRFSIVAITRYARALFFRIIGSNRGILTIT